MRHAKRLGKILQLLGEHPTESLPQAAGDATTSQAIYRFFSNPQVQPSHILDSHRTGVVTRIQACSTVLAIQDTTDLNFTSHPKTTGLGYINQTQQQGIKVHSSLAVSGAGKPLGLLHQQCWTRAERSGKKRARKTTAIQDKESYHWQTRLQAAEVGLPQSVQLVHVGDREADIFELFALPRRTHSG